MAEDVDPTDFIRKQILEEPERLMGLLAEAIASLRKGMLQQSAGVTPTGLYEANDAARELVTQLEALFDSD